MNFWRCQCGHNNDMEASSCVRCFPQHRRSGMTDDEIMRIAEAVAMKFADAASVNCRFCVGTETALGNWRERAQDAEAEVADLRDKMRRFGEGLRVRRVEKDTYPAVKDIIDKMIALGEKNA